MARGAGPRKSRRYFSEDRLRSRQRSGCQICRHGGHLRCRRATGSLSRNVGLRHLRHRHGDCDGLGGPGAAGIAAVGDAGNLGISGRWRTRSGQGCVGRLYVRGSSRRRCHRYSRVCGPLHLDVRARFQHERRLLYCIGDNSACRAYEFGRFGLARTSPDFQRSDVRTRSCDQRSSHRCCFCGGRAVGKATPYPRCSCNSPLVSLR